MKALKTLLATAAFGAAMAVAASASATVFIGVSTDDGATITLVATGATNAGVLGATYGAFTINNLSGTQGILPDLLNSNSLNTSSSLAGMLDIYVTDTDFAASTGANGFISGFTSLPMPEGWSLTESTYVNAGNTTPYSGGIGSSSVAGFQGTPMAAQTFTGLGSVSIGSLSPAVGPGPYSITEQYHVVATGAGSANGTIDVFAIPEPTTWALMIVGFGGVGAMVRSRRRQAAFA
jgi:hypothetical protein